MTKFWMQKSVPKITLVVERHGKSTWLMLQPEVGKPSKLAKFKSEDHAKEFWRAYTAHGMSMHALGALGI